MAIARAQLQACEVTHREYTGVGFFTWFSVPPEAPRLTDHGPREYMVGPQVIGEIEGVEHGACFLLFAKYGVISNLEGVTYCDPWPETIGKFSLRLFGSSPHDITNVEASKGWT